MINFGNQSDPKMVPLRPVFNTRLKVAQIDMYSKTDPKPVEIFCKNDQRPEFLLIIQISPKIGPYSPRI